MKNARSCIDDIIIVDETDVGKMTGAVGGGTVPINR